ncbi:GntR family transcriptional regulator [Streptomyces sp. NPDC004311]|uniref:GntR family transcriptional regulator n=1 Tax=Streptomyces sp. NPDC004311 TaxID=3364698 RepID=UPI00368D9DD8
MTPFPKIGASGPKALAVSDETVLSAVLADSRALGRVLRGRASHVPGHQEAAIKALTDRWIPVAELIRPEPTVSLADHCRWMNLINAARTPSAQREVPSLSARVACVRELLTAIRLALESPLTAAQLSAVIASAVSYGVYTARGFIDVPQLVVDLGAPGWMLKLSVADLVEEGVLRPAGHRYRVASGHSLPPGREHRIAARLRAQFAAGVYPAGTRLPRVVDLALNLVTDVGPLSRALRELEWKGLVVLASRRWTVTARVAELPPPPPPVPPLLAAVPYSASRVRETCRGAVYQWRYRIPESGIRDQWRELRAMAAQLLADTVARGGGIELRSARAREMATAMLPAQPEAALWHTACLAACVSDLMPAPRGTDRGTSSVRGGARVKA